VSPNEFTGAPTGPVYGLGANLKAGQTFYGHHQRVSGFLLCGARLNSTSFKEQFVWHPAHDDRRPSWAHVSGWMQLSSRRRQLSCILPAWRQASAMDRLLPALSDALTESGYPWEILAVDTHGQGGTDDHVRRWCSMPGHRLGVARKQVTRSVAVLAAIEASRGDAVMIVDPAAALTMQTVRRAIEQWNEGARLVVVPSADKSAEPAASHHADRSGGGRGPWIDSRHFGEGASDLVLLDRSLVDELLRDS
jgi:hypothetical protein